MAKTPKGMTFIQQNPEPRGDTVEHRNGVVSFWPNRKPWTAEFKCDGEVVTIASGSGVDAVSFRVRVATDSDEPVEVVEVLP